MSTYFFVDKKIGQPYNLTTLHTMKKHTLFASIRGYLIQKIGNVHRHHILLVDACGHILDVDEC